MDRPSPKSLMQAAFSPDKGLLWFNAGVTEHEKGEQQGMMYLFSGATAAIRNPRAHGLLYDDPKRAKECIVFVSMLAHAVDRSEKT
jgi:uncharacterized protein (TIGR02391 family)